MKGYPKFVATKQDFINLLAMPECKERAITELQNLYDLNDSKITRATTPKDPANPMSEWNTEIIENPMPQWKIKGFESREAVKVLIEAK